MRERVLLKMSFFFVYAHVYEFVCVFWLSCLYVCKYVFIVYVCTYASLCVYIHVCMHKCTNVSIHVCMHTCFFIYVSI